MYGRFQRFRSSSVGRSVSLFARVCVRTCVRVVRIRACMRTRASVRPSVLPYIFLRERRGTLAGRDVVAMRIERVRRRGMRMGL